MKQNAKTVLVWLAFPINAHQNANQKPIGSAPACRVQCTLSPHPIYQTLLFDFSWVWFQDYIVALFPGTEALFFLPSSPGNEATYIGNFQTPCSERLLGVLLVSFLSLNVSQTHTVYAE